MRRRQEVLWMVGDDGEDVPIERAAPPGDKAMATGAAAASARGRGEGQA